MTPSTPSASIRGMKFPLVFAAMVALQGGGLATVTDDLIEEFKDEVQSLPKDKSIDRGRIDLIVPLLRKTEWSESKNEQLLTYLDQARLGGPTEKLRAIAKTLSAELRKEIELHDAALLAEFTKTIGDGIKAIMTAKSPKDLDQPYAAVVKLFNAHQRSFRLPQLTEKRQQLEECMNLLRSVQDALTPITGNGPRRMYSTVSLLTNVDFSEWVPRSELTQRVKELQQIIEITAADGSLNADQWTKKVNALIGGIKTLDDLAGTLKAIDALPLLSSYGAPSLGVEDLRSYATAYEQLKRGQASTISFPDRQLRPNPNTAILQGVRDQLVAYALPRLLMLPEGTALKPGETALTFLQRTLAQAKEKRDWLLVGRALDLSQRFALQIGTVASDSSALTLFLAGYNQDRAQQYSQAVTSYLAVLKTGSQIVPAEHVGELLAALKKNHPTEYETASRAFEEAYLRAHTGGLATPFRNTGDVPATPGSKVTVPAKAE